MAEVFVFGAGMVGVSTALALQARGMDVLLIDKAAPGKAASYGNAGLIQAEAAEPYALPQDFATLLSYALEQSNDVVWKLAPALKMSNALWHYNRFSKPASHQAIAKTYSRLTARSTQDHQPLIEAAGAESLISRNGLYMLYRSEKVFEAAAKDANRIKALYGTKNRTLSGTEYRQIEPALRQSPAGMVHWQDSWSCSSPGELTEHYARLFEKRGGEIILADANRLERTSHGWQLQTSSYGKLTAEQAVICLGADSPNVLKRFGFDIPMIYKRGYHAHYQCADAPKTPFLDVENGVLASAMTKGLRVTSGAALVDLQSKAEPKQLNYGVEQLKSLLDIGEQVSEPQWFGTRPCLPDMLPLVGQAPGEQRLWFNFGHGHQGFTLGPTTAELLAQAMQDEPSDLAKALSPEQRSWIKRP